MPRPFLTARWSDIALLTFDAPEELIRRAIPPGVEPDRWNGRTHVSLVALRMLNVRILGWRIPGFASHPQVNFRTYVRVGSEPGVWFVRQLVPSRLIAAVGRLRYHEPFWPMAISARVFDASQEVRAEYAVGPRALGWHLNVSGSRAAAVPASASPEHHFAERVLACRALATGGLRTFRVEHPPWRVREVRSVDHRFDFGSLYGAEWEFLNRAAPVSVVFAEGSKVAVYPPSLVTVSGPPL